MPDTVTGIDAVLLVRALPGASDAQLADAVDQLGPAAGGLDVPTRIDLLVRNGLLESRDDRYGLSAQGRDSVRSYLGLESLPRGLTWHDLRDAYLVARALRLEPTAPVLRRLSGADGLRAEIIRQEFSLPLPVAPAASRMRNALSWRLLVDGASAAVVDRLKDATFTASAVLGAMIYSRLGIRGTPSAGKGLALLAAQIVESGTVDVGALRTALLRRLVREQLDAGGTDSPASGDAASLDAFARRVNGIARELGGGRVFIAHVRDAYARADGAGCDAAGFDRSLIEANRAGLVRLARADLAQQHDPRDVAASRLEYLTAVFHFVVVQ